MSEERPELCPLPPQAEHSASSVKALKDDLIVIEHLTKRFPKTPEDAIHDLNLRIPKQGIVGLVGPDGAGKTTLIRLMTGLLLPTNGIITIDGHDTVKKANEIFDIIGYMPQRFGLYEDLTVMQNLNLYADLQGVLGAERERRFDRLLTFTNLHAFTDRRAKALSGGMKQKLGLACALLRKPPLLLLDEPSVGVDPISRRELWKMVRELTQDGITVVWSTSYLDEAENCDRVILLDKGSVLYYGAPQDLTKRTDGRVYKISGITTSKRQILQKALQAPNVLDGVIQGSDVRLVFKEKKDPPIDLSLFATDPNVTLAPTPPRFEDSFMDLLGGGPKGESALAKALQKYAYEGGTDAVVDAHGLTKRFGTFTAVNNISFSVKRGEIFGLLGPNGAGKSTTFKMMCGLLRPTAGKALVNGVDLQVAPSEGRALLGYMSQKFSLYSILSVLQNLEFFAGVYNVPKERKRKTIDLIIDLFDFREILNETVGELPLGFKQRLALSCSVMHKPRVLFLDEPTSGVDPITRREFWNHINGGVENGATVVVTTHFMDEAEYCDRIGLVYNSNLIKVGTPDELKALCVTKETPSPTLEDAFIHLIEEYEHAHPQ
jgi:ABC-2 type transport system ATP-binding protein